jgi:acetyl-CoA synthetase
MSSQIESILHETRTFSPPKNFQQQAQITSLDQLENLRQQARHNPENFWAKLARQKITWHKDFVTTLNTSKAPFYEWFVEGELNISVNCLDRHLGKNKIAIIAEGERGDIRQYTYEQLHSEVCRFANALIAQGIGKGDRAIILLPNIPEAVIAMQACARLGIIHSVVFGGFSVSSLQSRIEDAGAKIVITADGGFRGGKTIALKSVVDQALAQGGQCVTRVIVLRRTHEQVAMQPKRDIFWDEAVKNESDHCQPVFVNSEHPLFLLYTSGSTGQPKGIQHSTAGYLLGAVTSMQWVFDLQAEDIFWCTADVGWVTGHTYVAYGPLACGATMVIYEGAPQIPNAGRFWEICQRHKVSIFYTAPTAIRALMRFGDDVPKQYNLNHLRLLGTVGEPINPEAWMWYHRVIGQERCPIVDTWWQTETGSIMIAPIPGAVATKPGSCTLPLPGIEAAIVDDTGQEVTDPKLGGSLVIKQPWPSMLRGIWGDAKRFQETYYARFNNRYYVAGDTAHQDEDGYFWIMGRSDDVLKVSGHRLGTMEIESALAAHPQVAEAAVVGKPDEIKGESVFAFVVTRGARTNDEALTQELRSWISEKIGAIAKPDTIRYADNLPKTRSGKIMRRLLKDIAAGKQITQDISTLENATVIDQLQTKERIET